MKAAEHQKGFLSMEGFVYLACCIGFLCKADNLLEAGVSQCHTKVEKIILSSTCVVISEN